MGRVVVVLGVEDGDQRVVRGRHHRREQAGILRDLSSRHGGDRAHDPVIDRRQRGFSEAGDLGLLSGAARAVLAAEFFDLIVVARPHLTREWGAAGKSSEDVLAQALTGTWRDVQVCMRTQALEFFDFSTRQIAACAAQIVRHLTAMQLRCTSEEPSGPLPRVKPGSQAQPQPSDNARTYRIRASGASEN